MTTAQDVKQAVDDVKYNAPMAELEATRNELEQCKAAWARDKKNLQYELKEAQAQAAYNLNEFLIAKARVETFEICLRVFGKA